MAIACCLVTLVTKCFYIMGGSLETMLVLGKIEYLGKCFANFFALLFILKWEKIKLPDWLINLLFGQSFLFYFDQYCGNAPSVLSGILACSV